MKPDLESHKPNPLKQGDETTMVSPVNLPPKQYQNYEVYKKYLKQKGLKFPDKFHISETDTVLKRVSLFNQAIKSGAKAIFPVAGNSYAEKIIPRVDYEAFEKHKPIFCTFSAASLLLIALQQKSHVPVFYGPHLSFLYSNSEFRKNPFAEDSFWNMLMQKSEVGSDIAPEIAEYVFKWENSLKLKNIFARNPKPKTTDAVRHFVGEKTNQGSSTVKGNLFPAFLQSIEKAIDKGLEVDFTDQILLVESDQIDYETAEKIAQKINSKSSLEKASAIIFAGITHHPHKEESGDLIHTLYNEKNIIEFTNNLRHLTRDNVPILFGFPMGHGDYKLTIPYGTAAKLHLESGDITLLENPFAQKK